jgi:DNA-3-methyladenine glycosylase II
LTERLDSAAALARHLAGLIERDGRLAAIAERAGPFEIRKTEPGFAGMAKIICGQQLSVASAKAIWGRFAALPGALQAQSYLALAEADVRAAGFSAGKYRTARAVAEALTTGVVDLDAIVALSAADATRNLIQIKGIGPWTAEIYLMFCAGHPDIFPAGDLALQKAVAHALGLENRPDIKELIAIAQSWSPHRATAALLFWRYYAAVRDKEGIAL